MNAILKNEFEVDSDNIIHHGVRYNIKDNEFYFENQKIKIQRNQKSLLIHFFKNPNTPHSKNALMDLLYGEKTVVDITMLNRFIKRMKNDLEVANAKLLSEKIISIHMVGYILTTT